MSLREIAREAGVSITTASRVLNNTALHKVGEDTRLRVLEIARAHRYRPNRQAVALACRRPPNTLGLVLPYGSPIFDTFYFAQVSTAVADVAADHGMDLSLLVQRDRSPERYLDFLSGHHVAGAILLGAGEDDADLLAKSDPYLPSVIINGKVSSPTSLSVTCDNRAGARAMTRHLIEHGHTRIGFIAGPVSQLDARERREGFREALRGAGLQWDEALGVRGDFHEDVGREAMAALLSLPNPPTAVFAANDQSAMGAIQAAKAAGLRIPQDVALAGFDDIPYARYMEPPLSTVHQSFYRLGETAAHLMLGAIRAGDAPRAPATHIVPTHLVPRASCGCVMSG